MCLEFLKLLHLHICIYNTLTFVMNANIETNQKLWQLKGDKKGTTGVQNITVKAMKNNISGVFCFGNLYK